MATRLTITAPDDYVLARDACSYGYITLAPNAWDPRRCTLHRVLQLADGPTRLAIAQPGPRGTPLTARADRALSRREQGEARRLVSRMLRLDEDARTIAAFHKVDPRWRRSGRGRLFRSPTLFEDVVKTITSCNVQWPGTVQMNARLCMVLGKPAPSPRDHWPRCTFPSAARLARTRPATLRSRCRVGYRDTRLVELARMFTSRRAGAPSVDADWLEDPATSDADAHAFLLTLPGVGPYAAANIMQLLGRYAWLPMDTEALRHGRTVLGFTGTDARIMARVKAHFTPFGEHAFRSYWFELWTAYEAKRGPAHTWDTTTRLPA